MKFKIKEKCRVVFINLVNIVFAFALSGCATSVRPAWTIHNPYDQVDWENHGQFKAALHMHTTMSDGRSTPDKVIDMYAGLGYSILSITDHDTVAPATPTWPWSDFERDPEALGMLAVKGNEISRPHHMGSYFNDYGAPQETSERNVIEAVGALNGLVVLFHPGRYNRSVEWYAERYRDFPHLVGLEIYNKGDRYPDDRDLWDHILGELIEERPVWGYSNDDMHNPDKDIGRNWNVFCLPELSLQNVRKAMQEGSFFYVYAPEGHTDLMPPVIESVRVDPRRGSITIAAAGHDRIEWISGGTVVHTGETIRLNEKADLSGYVRAVIHNDRNKSLIGTQPFRVSLSEGMKKVF